MGSNYIPASAINPTLGSLLVTIEGAQGQGIADVLVTATPPSGSPVTVTTTAGGCALFANVVTGTWSVAFGALSGYLTEQNQTSLPAQGSISVAASATSSLSFLPTSSPATAYDQLATVTPVYAVPMADGVHPALPTNVSSLPLSFYSANLTSSPYVTTSPAQVFPMPNTPSYYVVAGSCGTESAPGGGSVAGQPVTVVAGGTASPTINLVPVQIFVNQGGSLATPGAVVTSSVSNAAGNGVDANCPSSGSTTMPTLQLGNTTTVWSSKIRGHNPHGNIILVNSCGSGCSTRTTVTSSLNPSTFGASVTLTATAACFPTACSGGHAPPAGTVQFKDNGTNLGGPVTLAGGVATYTSSVLAVGSHPITAVYTPSSGTWVTSTSTSLSQVVNAAPTTTVLASNPNPNAYGTSAILTATVTANAPSTATPTGTVTFKNGAATICAAVALSSGSASCTLSGLNGGSYSVSAVYTPAPANFVTSTSATLTQSVTAASTSTALTANSNPSTFNASVTFTATVTPTSGAPAVGSVVFKDGATTLATVAVNGSGVATYATAALGLGSHAMSAVFTATSPSNFAASTGTLTQVVNPPPGTPYTLCGLPYGVWRLNATYLTFSSATEAVQVVVTIGPSGISLDGGATWLAAGSNQVTVYVK